MNKIQTPYLEINTALIKERYSTIKSNLPDFNIAYAIKANPDSRILDILKYENSHFETASIFEIRKLISFEVDPRKIVYSNPVKSSNHIREAIDLGVHDICFDSPYELTKFQGIECNLLFRIQVPNEGSIWPLSQKFGCPEKYWSKVFKQMKELNIQLRGITFHVGSQCESLKAWSTALELTQKAILEAQQYSLSPDTVNIGGGFPIPLGRDIPSMEDIGKVINDGFQKLADSNIQIRKKIAEPGRYISGEAGTLVASVIGITEREDNKWVFLDSGVFSGMLETIDGFTYPIETTATGEIEKVTLCGPSCDSLDTMFTLDMPLPKEGDIISFFGTGAYSTVYASPFNGFKCPQTIVK